MRLPDGCPLLLPTVGAKQIVALLLIPNFERQDVHGHAAPRLTLCCQFSE